MRGIELIVIGGSAGALDGLLTLVPALPESLACPIVVVLHLPPAGPSLVPTILSRVTSRSVREADDKEPLAERTIHVAPPNYHVMVSTDRALSLSVDEPVRYSRPAIDVLFESAADAYGAAVAGVVLSGANEDGADGLRCIQRVGGVAIVQAPETASSPMMPKAALRRAGPSTHVVPLLELGAFLGSLGAAKKAGGAR